MFFPESRLHTVSYSAFADPADSETSCRVIEIQQQAEVFRYAGVDYGYEASLEIFPRASAACCVHDGITKGQTFRFAAGALDCPACMN
ncbi:hypothetical protein AU184_08205 [Mycolicibacterium novocastrense]|nr:hypothetical protein AU072_07865 [Mycolicibacterium novocastrense]KUH77538.1 hypothetical protein AU184_08205 [Mycolicibacterium novocastrense]